MRRSKFSYFEEDIKIFLKTHLQALRKPVENRHGCRHHVHSGYSELWSITLMMTIARISWHSTCFLTRNNVMYITRVYHPTKQSMRHLSRQSGLYVQNALMFWLQRWQPVEAVCNTCQLGVTCQLSPRVTRYFVTLGTCQCAVRVTEIEDTGPRGLTPKLGQCCERPRTSSCSGLQHRQPSAHTHGRMQSI